MTRDDADLFTWAREVNATLRELRCPAIAVDQIRADYNAGRTAREVAAEIAEAEELGEPDSRA